MTIDKNLNLTPPNEAGHGIVDTRISEMYQVLPPIAVIEKFPATEFTNKVVSQTRREIHNIFNGLDDRLVVIAGPCSTVGWKGLINDPGLDDSHDINQGLRIARKLLCEINSLGMPAATEFLDPITVQYIDDFISWGAIGARTTESQLHRQLASGLSMPIGFKNATDGSVKIAIDATIAAENEHTFMSVSKMGHVAIVHTKGNEDCHVILRGGHEPNYSAKDVQATCEALEKANLKPMVMIDASHSNSHKQYKKQVDVSKDVAGQIAAGDNRIFGLMLESNLVEGRQDLQKDLRNLVYGQSVTDACIGMDDTEAICEFLNNAVLERRKQNQDKK